MKKTTFNLVSALNLIAIESDLSQMFTAKFPFGKNDSFSKLISLAENGKVPTDKVKFIEGTYENVILSRPAFLDKYKAFLANATKPASKKISINPNSGNSPVRDTESLTNKMAFSSIDSEKKTAPKDIKNSGLQNQPVKLPKEYNKTRVLEDIAARGGGKPTEFENAVLELNDLKNMYYNLNAKCNRRRYRNTNDLSDADCRDITAAIATFKKKMAHLIK